MPDYQAQILGADGLVIEVVEMDCTDDAAATRAACKLADGQNMHLRRDDQKLGGLHTT
jgi:hypothetical protein